MRSLVRTTTATALIVMDSSSRGDPQPHHWLPHFRSDGRPSMHRRTRRKLGALVFVPLLMLAAACGGSDSSSEASAGATHNDTDVSFASNMIRHHAQAIEMADLAESQAQDPTIVALAKRIQAAQQPEIDAMSRWLDAWGESVPDTTMGSMHGMDHGDMGAADMAGMMTSPDMRLLSNSSGQTFDRLWLQMMIEHHQGAVEMSKTELRDGDSADATTLAQQIIEAQEAEISTMQGLLIAHD